MTACASAFPGFCAGLAGGRGAPGGVWGPGGRCWAAEGDASEPTDTASPADNISALTSGRAVDVSTMRTSAVLRMHLRYRWAELAAEPRSSGLAAECARNHAASADQQLDALRQRLPRSLRRRDRTFSEPGAACPFCAL